MRLVTLLCALLLGVTENLAQRPEPSDLKDDAGVQTGVKPIAAKTGAITLSPEKANPVRIARFERPPVIDGNLDEEVWKQAAALGNFYQTQPGDNIAPSHPTSVLIGYDSKSLYVAFRAYDEPDKVRATVAKRDQIFGDDTVHLILDTFNDRRKGYILAFNPLGVQADQSFLKVRRPARTEARTTASTS